MTNLKFETNKNINSQNLLQLYEDAGWKIYTSDLEKLCEAINNSLYVLSAWDKNKLVGLLRAVGDGLTIIYIQDILVLRDYQRQGIGSQLIKTTLEKYSKVRQIVLLTDAKEDTTSFYENSCFAKVTSLGLNTFIKINE